MSFETNSLQYETTVHPPRHPIQSTDSSSTLSSIDCGQVILSKSTIPMPLPLCCHKCPDKFMHLRFLNLHIAQVHDRHPVHHCPHCRGPYATTNDLNEHILQDHRNDLKPYQCNQCPCSFSTQMTLRLHISEIHTQVLRACDSCGFQTQFEGAFVRHMEDVHQVIIKFEGRVDSYSAREARTIGFIPGI